tara:strand:- start:800 stop:1057 length:258 start_codon:yes stop_codon:yes gene_type:complete
VPSLIVRKLLSAKDSLQELAAQDLNYFSVEELRDQVSELRYRLSDIDNAYEEVQDIVTGYAAAQSPLPPAETTTEELINEQEEEI